MKRIKYCSVVALFYTFLFTIAPFVNDVFLLKFKEAYSVQEIIQITLFTFIFTTSFFYLLSLNRKFFFVSITSLFFLSGIVTFYVYSLNISFSYRTIALLMETNLQTFATVINYKVIIFVFISTVLGLLQAKLSKNYLLPLEQDKFGRSDTKTLPIICAFIILINITLSYSKLYLPQSIFYSFKEYFQIFHAESDKQLPSKSTYKGADDLVVVLVVGESIRGDKFSINGYEKKTSPKLEQINNIVSYPKFSSCEVLSVISLPCLLTNRSIDNPLDKSKNLSFQQVFKQEGFSTYWVNEHFHGVLKSEYELISDAYDKVFNRGQLGNPEKSLESINSILKNKGKKLIVYHTFLSHWPYFARYPKKFNKWQPICSKKPKLKDVFESGNLQHQISNMKECSKEELSNEYENSILYVDDVLSRLINKLKDKRAILFFTSDHGESLGENGYYLHGGYKDRFIKEQRNVPFMFWASDNYLKNKGNAKAFKKSKAKLNNSINHDYLFNSIIDCAAIETKDIDKKKSICR